MAPLEGWNHTDKWTALEQKTEKEHDVWHVVDDYYGQAVGKLQAESMMSTAASLFPQ
jgi:hypothetical protein